MLVSYLVSNLMPVRCQIEKDQMQEITFYPSKAKYLLGLSASLLFTERGVSMAYDGEWMGHFVYLFFGLLSVLFVILLLPGLPDAKYLKLRDDEFEFRRLFSETDTAHVFPNVRRPSLSFRVTYLRHTSVPSGRLRSGFRLAVGQKVVQNQTELA